MACSAIVQPQQVTHGSKTHACNKWRAHRVQWRNLGEILLSNFSMFDLPMENDPGSDVLKLTTSSSTLQTLQIMEEICQA